MERAQILEKLIDESWSSKRQFAESIGIPPTTLQSILKRGVGKASIDNVIRVCRGLGITVDQLERMTTPKSTDVVRETQAVYRIASDRYAYYPIAVSAGLPSTVDCLMESDVEQIEVPDSVMGKWAGSADVFMMRVNGDSMNKVIPHDSLIAVKKVDVLKLNDGDIVVFSDENEYSVKRFYNDSENERFVFRPDSSNSTFLDYSVKYSQAKNLIIHGKVVVYIVELS